MFKTISLLLIASLILSTSATGQQTLSPEQTRQTNKIIKKLAHLETGTKLDVKLTDGSHHIGNLTETGSAAFILTDPVSHISETISYQDVKHLQPTRKEYMTQQLGKTGRALPKIAGISLLIVAGLLVLALHNVD